MTFLRFSLGAGLVVFGSLLLYAFWQYAFGLDWNLDLTAWQVLGIILIMCISGVILVGDGVNGLRRRWREYRLLREDDAQND